MAKSGAVWGIDIGQCAIKALRCRPHEDSGRLIADAFDYIEYPKILSQPEAEPETLVAEALEQFLSRNDVRGDQVAIAVPGQSGLARFIKLPPVESKKIPDIVKYEARQQIPFAIEDVVWDYQQMAGGSVEEGFALETEVGLFAMRHDQVTQSMAPFADKGIEVDLIQLTPLALYNFCVFDLFPNLPPPEEYDPENPPESVVMLSLGTDTTDLVVTNGYRVWQRSIPLGGNHFTKALTKELKLTFAKAEHLKRDAAKAENPKAVFQAMRPVFNDLLTEVQRSLGYFNNIDRNAKIGRIVGLGNAMKLPGLQRYLSQNLGQTVVKIDGFQRLSGPGVVDSPAFKNNVLGFPACYGLAVQSLHGGAIQTNLLPPEIRQDRMIRSKQPWAIGAAAALLLGLTLSSFGYYRAWRSADTEDFDLNGARAIATQSSSSQSEYEDALSELETTQTLLQSIAETGANRFDWAQLWQSITAALPSDPPGERSEKLAERNIIYIDRIDSEYVSSSLSNWWNSTVNGKSIKEHFELQKLDELEQPEVPVADAGADGEAGEGGQADPGQGDDLDAGGPPAQPPRPDPGPSSSGWVFRMVGFHFHNDRDPAKLADSGKPFVIKTLINNLNKASLVIDEATGETVPMGDFGIAYPVVIDQGSIEWEHRIKQEGNRDNADGKPQPIYRFEVQFVWLDERPMDEEQTGLPSGQVAGGPLDRGGQ